MPLKVKRVRAAAAATEEENCTVSFLQPSLEQRIFFVAARLIGWSLF